MTHPHEPPAFAERMLRTLISDPDWAEAITGDLREEFDFLAARRGTSVARRWYWRQVVTIAGRRIVRAPIPRRRRPLYSIDADPQRHWLAGLRQDLTYARRSLLHNWPLTAAIVVVLSVGLAVNATVFTMADALVLRPFRFAGVERAVVIKAIEAQDDGPPDANSVAPGDYVEWRNELRSVTPLAAAQYWNPNLVENGEAEALSGVRVSASFFDLLGVSPFQGRGFQPDDERPGTMTRVIVSHRLWQRRFGGDPKLIGRTLRLDGQLAEVLGIAPEGFDQPLGADIWSALALDASSQTDRRRGYLMVAGRLSSTASLAEARAELEALAARQRTAYPETNGKRRITLDSYAQGMADPVARPFVAIWQLAALLLLAVAAANVVNLLLARAAERQQEFAVRLALGAGRARLTRQLVIEGGLLASVAAALAIPLAAAALGLTRQAMPAEQERFVPGWHRMELAVSTVVITIGLAALTTLLITAAPIAQTLRATVVAALRNGGRTLTPGTGRLRGRALLAGGQIALTLALATAAGLGIDAVRRVTRMDVGFVPDNVLMVRLLVPDDPYDNPERRRQFFGGVLERLASVPAVRDAAVSSSVPHGFAAIGRPFLSDHSTLKASEARMVDLQRVSEDYFSTLQIPVMSGRVFSGGDTPTGLPVAVVSASLAKREWPDADPLGKRFRLAENGPWLTVVGVVGDVPFSWIRRDRTAWVYRPASQEPPFNMYFVVNAAGDPLSLGGEVRRAIAATDANVPVQEMAAMPQIIDERSAGLVMAARMLTTIGTVSLLLALVGVYSLMSYLTSRRTLEVGVRVACGATSADVLRLLVRPAARIAIAGLGAGVVLALALARLMQSALFGLVVMSGWLVAVLALALGLAALAASALPARRLASIDPSVALRSE